MKKFFVSIAIFATMFLMVSCGGDSSGDDSNSGKTEEPSNSDPGNGDSGATTNDPDTNADTESEQEPENNTVECKDGLCTDSESNFTWSSISKDVIMQVEAVSYCDNLSEGGFEDWHLPKIEELRTLLKNCEKSTTTESCLLKDSEGSCSKEGFSVVYCNCSYKDDGSYSKLGDKTQTLWSSTLVTEDQNKAWGIRFSQAEIDFFTKEEAKYNVRCVRNAN